MNVGAKMIRRHVKKREVAVVWEDSAKVKVRYNTFVSHCYVSEVLVLPTTDVSYAEMARHCHIAHDVLSIKIYMISDRLGK